MRGLSRGQVVRLPDGELARVQRHAGGVVTLDDGRTVARADVATLPRGVRLGALRLRARIADLISQVPPQPTAAQWHGWIAERAGCSGKTVREHCRERGIRAVVERADRCRVCSQPWGVVRHWHASICTACRVFD